MDAPVRCFLENDLEVDDFDKIDFEEKTGLDFDKSFQYVITDAFRLKPETWKAIKKSDEIWMSTHFIGSSFSLLLEMIDMGLSSGLKNKMIFNLIAQVDLVNKIPVELSQKLLESNIRFVFREYLLEMQNLNKL